MQSRTGLAVALRGARIPIPESQYVKLATRSSGYAVIAGAVLSTLYAVFTGGGFGGAVAAFFFGGLFGGAATLAAFRLFPMARAASRARRIDAEFPSVVILCYALSKGGVDPVAVFRVVRDEVDTFGEISREFGAVVRSVEWLGMDIDSALEDAASLTPSANLREFFRGLVAILNSGADAETYFRRQSDMLLADYDTRVEKDLDMAGFLAEIYVSGILVLPLLLIVVISVMSVFGGGFQTIVNAIVFVFIPVGTAGFLILVDTMLPSEDLGVAPSKESRVADFGADAVTRNPGLLTSLETTAAASGPAPNASRFAAFWHDFKIDIGERLRRARFHPIDLLEVSGAIAMTVLAVGGILVWAFGARGEALAVNIITLGILTIVVAMLPVAAFHEVRVWHARRVDATLPETLSRLSSFNDKGLTILQSFQIVGRASRKPIGPELARLEKDVETNHDFSSALMRFRDRLRTPRLARLATLLRRTSTATNELKDVLEVAARESTSVEAARSRLRQGMMTYVLVIYVVFAVFLYVTVIVADTFFGHDGFAFVSENTANVPGLAAGIGPSEARLVFFMSVLIQGAAAGIAAGRLGEGYVTSGIKHAILLTLVAWLVYYTRVIA